MNPNLQSFIAEHCHIDARATVKLKEFIDRFHDYLPEPERAGWTRSRIILDLGKSFPIGVDGSNILRVAGLAFQPPTPWRVVDGKLTHTR